MPDSARVTTAVVEVEASGSAAADSSARDAGGDDSAVVADSGAAGDAAALSAARAAARRKGKPDSVLSDAVDFARDALAPIAAPDAIGEHLGMTIEAERLVTHRFASKLAGYVGWNWFATLARAPRAKEVTVCEIGLLPSEAALLAPSWVPWADRIRPEDVEPDAKDDAAAAGSEAAGSSAGDEKAAEDDSDAASASAEMTSENQD